MNLITVLFGAVLALFGASTLVLRHTHPSWFKKLGPMKKLWGDKLGYIVHFIGYSLVPLFLGCILIFKGLQGVSLFD